MEIKVNDYVRTKEGLIGKIIDIDLGNFQTRYELNNSDEFHYEDRKDIIKSSPNIIDLIEVGDIIKLDEDRTYIVMEKTGKYIKTYDEDYLTIEDIKSVLTKEQFKQMEYKLEKEVN